MTASTNSDQSAVVAGGGIGGLAAAIGLCRVGWSVTVLERAADLGERGAGWSFAPNAVRAIDALGLGEEFRAISVPSQAGATLRRPDGTYLMRFRQGRDTALLANHRAELHRMLTNQLPADSLHSGAEVTGVRQSEGAVSVTYRTDDQRHDLTAALLVAADGIHSTVRPSLWPQAPAPVFQRILCWRGVTEPGSVWPVEGFQTWGRGARFGAHPLSRQRVYWFLAIRQNQPHHRYDDDLAEARRRTSGWHTPIPALLDATPPGAVLRHDIYDLEPLPSYVQDRVALLGDAAHAMTPFLAQGACQAFEDATVLAAALADNPDLPIALAGYDQARRPRSQQVVKMARLDPKISLSTSALTYRLMTTLTRLAPAGISDRKTARLWSWTPPRSLAPSRRTREC